MNPAQATNAAASADLFAPTLAREEVADMLAGFPACLALFERSISGRDATGRMIDRENGLAWVLIHARALAAESKGAALRDYPSSYTAGHVSSGYAKCGEEVRAASEAGKLGTLGAALVEAYGSARARARVGAYVRTAGGSLRVAHRTAPFGE